MESVQAPPYLPTLLLSCTPHTPCNFSVYREDPDSPLHLVPPGRPSTSTRDPAVYTILTRQHLPGDLTAQLGTFGYQVDTGRRPSRFTLVKTPISLERCVMIGGRAVWGRVQRLALPHPHPLVGSDSPHGR